MRKPEDPFVVQEVSFQQPCTAVACSGEQVQECHYSLTSNINKAVTHCRPSALGNSNPPHKILHV